MSRLEQRPGYGYKQEQMANSCCPLSCQGPEDLSANWSGANQVSANCQRQRCMHVNFEQFLACFCVVRVCQR